VQASETFFAPVLTHIFTMEEISLELNRPTICEAERAVKCLKATDCSLLVRRFDEIGLSFMNRKPGGSRKTFEAQ